MNAIECDVCHAAKKMHASVSKIFRRLSLSQALVVPFGVMWACSAMALPATLGAVLALWYVSIEYTYFIHPDQTRPDRGELSVCLSAIDVWKATLLGFVLHFAFHVLHFMCCISCLAFHVSHFIFRISCVTFHCFSSRISCLAFHISHLAFQMSPFAFHMSHKHMWHDH